MAENRIWSVQSSSDAIPIRLKYMECLEKIEAQLQKFNKPIPGDENMDYVHMLPTIIFSEVLPDNEGYYVEMTCYADVREFRRASRR